MNGFKRTMPETHRLSLFHSSGVILPSRRRSCAIFYQKRATIMFTRTSDGNTDSLAELGSLADSSHCCSKTNQLWHLDDTVWAVCRAPIILDTGSRWNSFSPWKNPKWSSIETQQWVDAKRNFSFSDLRTDPLFHLQHSAHLTSKHFDHFSMSVGPIWQVTFNMLHFYVNPCCSFWIPVLAWTDSSCSPVPLW